MLANEAYLGNPTAVKAGPDDSIYVSSSAFRKVKRIDRYGYLSNFAGDGTHGTIVPGTSAASAPIGAVQDIDIDPAGNLYLFNDWNQIVRVDNGVVNKLVYDNGVENSAARFNLAAVNVDLVYFVNYLENRVYRMIGTSKSDYVTDNLPYDNDGADQSVQLPAAGAVVHHLRVDERFADLRGHRQRPDHAVVARGLEHLLPGRRRGRHPLFRRDRPARDGAFEAEGGRLQPDHREDLLRRGVEQSGVVHRRGGEGASACRHRSDHGSPATAAPRRPPD